MNDKIEIRNYPGRDRRKNDISISFQYDEHLTQLEKNILLVQKRAMEQADIDPSWLGPDDEVVGESRDVMIMLIFTLYIYFFIYNFSHLIRH